MNIFTLDQERMNNIIRQSLNNQNQEKRQEKNPISWESSYTLESLSLPQVVISPTITKKFKIYIQYRTPQQGLKTKQILFGHGDEFVFNHDNQARLRKLNSIKNKKNRQNLLSSQYWETVLLQTGQNFVKNVKDVVSNHLQYVWKQANTKHPIPRKDFTQVIKKRKTTMEENRLKHLQNKDKN